MTSSCLARGLRARRPQVCGHVDHDFANLDISNLLNHSGAIPCLQLSVVAVIRARPVPFSSPLLVMDVSTWQCVRRSWVPRWR